MLFRSWNRIAGLPVVNAGYSGIWTEALGARLSRLLAVTKPSIAVLLVGTNDAKKGQGESELAAVARHYEHLVGILKSAGVPTILITPPPVESGKRLTGFYSPAAMAHLAQMIRQAGEEAGLAVLDLHLALRDGQELARTGATTDGVHLSPAAYELLRDMLERDVARLKTFSGHQGSATPSCSA